MHDPTTTRLIQRDLEHVWHPCSQMKDYEVFKPLVIKSANGSYLELTDGKKMIDAISSWWCKSLGHRHPQLKQALLRQLDKFEHVILANTTHETIVNLSEQLAKLSPSLTKAFYASDGSSAVEIAMKMSLHLRQIKGESKRTHFIALENAYHGETLGALSVSDVGLYRKPYESALFNTHFISPLPYVASTQDPLWHDCEAHWQAIETQLQPLRKTTTAILIEPIIQGAGGMRLYSQDFLKRLRAWTLKHNIHLIADEIMTGIGRTGKWLACHHADIEPDMLCLSKGLTSGWLPLSVVMTRPSIYDVFYADYETGKAFLHSHTYSGNALAASVALEVLEIMTQENICHQVTQMEAQMRQYMQEIASETGKLSHIRGIGGIMAADLMPSENHPRIGFLVSQKAMALGALLRPLGNTLYWLPPLNCSNETLTELKQITQQSIERCYAAI